MPTELKIPALGEGIESGDVLEVFVKPGDTIKKDDALLELETDKATVTVPASTAGKVVAVLVSAGQTVKIGEAVVTVEATSAAAAPAPAATAPAPEKPAPAVSKPPPSSATKPALSPKAPVAPVPAQPALAPIAPIPASPTLPPVPARSALTDEAQIPAGPAMRRFAREVGVNLATVQGSGDNGRITRDDILSVVRSGTSRANLAAAPQATSPAPGGPSSATSHAPLPGQPDQDSWGPVRVEKMSRLRQTIAHKMHESWTTVPRVTNFDDADVTDLEQIRQNNKADYEASRIKLTTLPFIVKAVAMALKNHPVVNASINMEAGQIIYKDYINVGIAVDSDRGLVVPALRNVDKLGIPDIARALSEVAERVRNGSFGVEDLRGGTFTISNLGAIGGTYSTPIINVPESSILLVGRSRRMPVAIGDDIRIRLMMPLSLSYDHRLIDGAAAARFLNDVIGYLEAPSRLLLAL